VASGKYVVEWFCPGFELVKEEDKNILIGDNTSRRLRSSSALRQRIHSSRPGLGRQRLQC